MTDAAKPKILLVEPNTAVRDGTRILWETQHPDYDVMTATSAAEALATFREYPGQWSGILTSTQPGGMEAVTLIERLRGEDSSVPIIAWHTTVPAEQQHALRAAGADAVFEQSNVKVPYQIFTAMQALVANPPQHIVLFDGDNHRRKETAQALRAAGLRVEARSYEDSYPKNWQQFDGVICASQKANDYLLTIMLEGLEATVPNMPVAALVYQQSTSQALDRESSPRFFYQQEGSSISEATIQQIITFFEEETKKPKILLVVRDDALRNEMQAYIEGKGYQVIEARNAYSGLQAFDKHPDLRGIIADKELDHKDGIEMTRDIRACEAETGVPKDHGIPIMLQSGNNHLAVVRIAEEAGVNGFYLKYGQHPPESPIDAMLAQIEALAQERGRNTSSLGKGHSNAQDHSQGLG